MKRFQPRLFLHLANIAGMYEVLNMIPAAAGLPAPETLGLVGDKTLQTLRQSAEMAEADCRTLGLMASTATCERLKGVLSSPQPERTAVTALYIELQGRVNDELNASLIFAIDGPLVPYYSAPDLFGPDVTRNFPSAILDIEEAGKCLALDRGTACVFHVSRVLEVGLKALGKALGIPYAPSWESYLNQIDKQIGRDWKDKEPEWKKDEAFYSAAAGDLLIVKHAWRNPTMHVRINYDPAKARDIFDGARTLMQHLATKLHEEP